MGTFRTYAQGTAVESCPTPCFPLMANGQKKIEKAFSVGFN
jgi:hypothetical protein